MACCLPCPVEKLFYGGEGAFTVSETVAAVSLAGCAFLILSWLVLPKERSGRRYLGVGLVAAVTVLSVCFYTLFDLCTWQTDMSLVGFRNSDLNTAGYMLQRSNAPRYLHEHLLRRYGYPLASRGARSWHLDPLNNHTPPHPHLLVSYTR